MTKGCVMEELLSEDACSWDKLTKLDWRNNFVIVRLVISGLSAIGALSVILSIVVTCSFKKNMIHPLLALCVADLLLSLLFVAGGALWLAQLTLDFPLVQICLLISRLTLIVYYAVILLQLVYAILAYYYIRRTTEGITTQVLIGNTRRHDVSCWKVSVAYILAWVIPICIVAIPYIGLSIKDNETYKSPEKKCSRCLPALVNVLPYSFENSSQAENYTHYINTLHLVTDSPLIAVTLIVGVAMVAIFLRLWCFIKSTQNVIDTTRPASRNQELQNFISRQQKSYKRIIAFLTYFVVLVILTFATLVAGVVYTSKDLNKIGPLKDFDRDTIIVFMLNAVVVPLQGFVNALIFGWTRASFREGLWSRCRGNQAPLTISYESIRTDFSPVSSGSVKQ